MLRSGQQAAARHQYIGDFVTEQIDRVLGEINGAMDAAELEQFRSMPDVRANRSSVPEILAGVLGKGDSPSAHCTLHLPHRCHAGCVPRFGPGGESWVCHPPATTATGRVQRRVEHRAPTAQATTSGNRFNEDDAAVAAAGHTRQQPGSYQGLHQGAPGFARGFNLARPGCHD